MLNGTAIATESVAVLMRWLSASANRAVTFAWSEDQRKPAGIETEVSTCDSDADSSRKEGTGRRYEKLSVLPVDFVRETRYSATQTTSPY